MRLAPQPLSKHSSSHHLPIASASRGKPPPPPPPPEPILRLCKSLIRPVCEGDAGSLASQANNPEIARWMSNAFPHPYRVEDAAEWISSSVLKKREFNI